MEHRATRRRMHKSYEVAPLKAVLHWGERVLPVDTPGLVQKGLEPDAVFVHCPQLDDAVRECRGNFAQEGAQSRLEGRLRHRIGLEMAPGGA